MYHNAQLAVESFIQYDMNLDKFGNTLTGINDDGTNDWNFNDISSFISIGGDVDGNNVLQGFYSELRVDNRFVDRKELAAWNQKVVPFNDPTAIVNPNFLARTFDTNTLTDIWTLKTQFDVGAKGHHFGSNTHRRFTYEGGESRWALTPPVINMLENSNFQEPVIAHIITDAMPANNSNNQFPINLSKTLTIKVTYSGSRSDADSVNGLVINFFTDPTKKEEGIDFLSLGALVDYIQTQMDLPANRTSNIRFLQLPNGRLEFYVNDLQVNSLQLLFEQGSNADEFGFIPTSTHTWVGTNNANGSTLIVQNFAQSSVTFNGVVDSSGQQTVSMDYSPESIWIGGQSISVSRNATISTANKYLDAFFSLKPSSQLELYSDANQIQYTFSMAVYSESDISSLDLIFVVKNSSGVTEYAFDTMERMYGFWWTVSKTIKVTDVSEIFGVRLKTNTTLRYATVQLEKNSFATPYVIDSDLNLGRIEINKGIANKSKGVFFFRFKPLFAYTETTPVVLFEALTSKLDIDGVTTLVDPKRGFKVYYRFDTASNIGIISFRINNIENIGDKKDSGAWDLMFPQKFWDAWHTIAISYDFDSSRYDMMFDYFKQLVDANLTSYSFYTNLYIGGSAPVAISNGVPDFGLLSQSAGMLVRDVIVTSYPVSEIELSQWINAEEFYKESILTNIFAEYEKEIVGTLAKISQFSTDTFLIEKNITDLQTKVTAIENVVSADIDFEKIKTRQDQLIITVNNAGIDITNLHTQADALSASIASDELRLVADEAEIVQLSNLITNETNNRSDAIANLQTRLAAQTNHMGASMIGIYDPNSKFVGQTAEDAIYELEHRVDVSETNISALTLSDAAQTTSITLMQQGDGSVYQWTAAKAVNNGWNIAKLRADVDTNTSIINSVQQQLTAAVQNNATFEANLASSTGSTLVGFGNSEYAAITIHDALVEIAGNGRTNQTVKSNWDAIQVNAGNISTLQSQAAVINVELLEIGKVKDGGTGITWTAVDNLKAHGSRLTTAETTLVSNGLSITQFATHLTALDTDVVGLNQQIANEIASRVGVVTTMASSAGAGTVGIADAGSLYAATTVESALQEIATQVSVLKGQINWKDAVANMAALPTTGSNIGDARTVMDAGDGKPAQFVWNGTVWIKIADIDWGTASDISYNDTVTQMGVSTVQQMIEKLAARTVSPSIKSFITSPQDWFTSGQTAGKITLTHNLGTMNVVVRATDTNGTEIGLDSITRTSIDTVELTASSPIFANITIFAASNNYSTVIGNWTPAGNNTFSQTINHGLGTKDVAVSIFNQLTGELVGIDAITAVDANTVRVVVSDNTSILNVFILKASSSATVKDINYWTATASGYSTQFAMSGDYDAYYGFYDATTGATVNVNSVALYNGVLTITKSSSAPIRMVIIK